MISECSFMKDCAGIIPLMEWKHAPRQGTNNRGKQNTQLELASVHLPVNMVIQKFATALEKAKLHLAEYE